MQNKQKSENSINYNQMNEEQKKEFWESYKKLCGSDNKDQQEGSKFHPG